MTIAVCIMIAVVSVLPLITVNAGLPIYLPGSSGRVEISSGDLDLLTDLVEQEWLIVVPQEHNVTVLIQDLDLGGIASVGCHNTSRLELSSTSSSGGTVSTVLCGKLPMAEPFTSAISMISVKLLGKRDELVTRRSLFTLVYSSTSNWDRTSSGTIAPTLPVCGTCGGLLYKVSDTVQSPNYPKPYYQGCDCRWLVSVSGDFIIKFTFWKFDLKPLESGLCVDYVEILDGSEMTAKSLGKFCGDAVPGAIKTSGSSGVLHFVSDGPGLYSGFEILYTIEKKPEQLAGLKSVAAILGSVSFGIFICLLLCSVLYKRIADRRNTANSTVNTDAPADDFQDVVQAAAPPSYAIVMATPDRFPTPEVTPRPSPCATPQLYNRSPFLRPLIHHVVVTVNDEPYSEDSPDGAGPAGTGDAEELPSYPDALHRRTAELLPGVPPPPSYEEATDDESVSRHITPRTRHQPVIKVNLLGENGQPPTYEAVTSGSEAFGSSGSDAESRRSSRQRARGQLRSRSERSSLSNLYRDRLQRTAEGDSDDDDAVPTLPEAAEENEDAAVSSGSPVQASLINAGRSSRTRPRPKWNRTDSRDQAESGKGRPVPQKNSLDVNYGNSRRSGRSSPQRLSPSGRHPVLKSSSTPAAVDDDLVAVRPSVSGLSSNKLVASHVSDSEESSDDTLSSGEDDNVFERGVVSPVLSCDRSSLSLLSSVSSAQVLPVDSMSALPVVAGSMETRPVDLLDGAVRYSVLRPSVGSVDC